MTFSGWQAVESLEGFQKAGFPRCARDRGNIPSEAREPYRGESVEALDNDIYEMETIDFPERFQRAGSLAALGTGEISRAKRGNPIATKVFRYWMMTFSGWQAVESLEGSQRAGFPRFARDISRSLGSRQSLRLVFNQVTQPGHEFAHGVADYVAPGAQVTDAAEGVRSQGQQQASGGMR